MVEANGHHMIDLLEARLRRIEYIVHGHKIRSTVTAPVTALQRLKELERELDHVTVTSPISQTLLELYKSHPEIFQGASDNDFASSDIASRLSVILAMATTYPGTASSLVSILDMPVPPADKSVQIIETQHGVAKLQLLQTSQLKEVAELKRRSATILQRWVSVDVLKGGEYWTDVEERLEHVEQSIRKATRMKNAEEGIV